MPPPLIFDISTIDLDAVLFNQEQVRQCNPQRGDMEQLNGITHADSSKGEIVGFKNVGADEFWVSGHIPGRPLLPGVLMIECAAQLASFYTRQFVGWKGFIGFGGVDGCKFRQQVTPCQKMYVLCKKTAERHHRITCKTQGVVNGQLVFEAEIVGMEF